MKKILFTLFIISLSIMKVNAFDIDINKIDIDSKASVLTDKLSKKYKIEIEDFEKEISNDENALRVAKELVRISLSDDSKDEKNKEIGKYMYLSETNGADSLTGSLFLKMYIDQLEKDNIKADRIRDIKSVNFNVDEAMVFVYLDDAKVNDQDKDVILVYWLKKNNEDYKVYYPWIKMGDDLNEYFKKVAKNEDEGIVIGESFNKISLTGEENQTVDKKLLNELYQDAQDSVVQITGMKGNGTNSYGSGFFIREGVVVTTWSLFLQFLSQSNYIYINDISGNNYDILGVVAAQIDYDVVVLKVDKNMGKGVTFGTSNDLKLDDKLFMVNSKNNGGFSINYGSFISLDKGKIENMFLLNSSDVGAALFTKDGSVVGINTADKLNSELSYANSTDYLKELQNILNKQDYKNITYTSLQTFKDNYYIDVKEEKESNQINKDIWNKYKMIGDIESNINIPLVKAYYKDDILSLRYKITGGDSIDSIYLLSSYTEELVKSGYKLTYEDKYKKIYKSNQYKVIIKNNLNYLIILMMEN